LLEHEVAPRGVELDSDPSTGDDPPRAPGGRAP
jgi:hypothetical protein